MIQWFKQTFLKQPPIVVEVQDRLSQISPFNKDSQFENPVEPINKITAKEAIGAFTFSPDLYAVIKLKARMISSLPLKYYWIKESGERVERTTGPIIELLENPNPNTTKTQLVNQYVSWYELTGDAYMVMETIEGRDYLFVLNTEWVRPIVDARFGLDGIIYLKHKGKEIYYSRDQVIRWTDFNPSDDFYGMSPVQPLSEDIQARRSAIKQSKNHYKKGGLSGGILVIPENIDATLLEQLKKDWNRRTEDSSRLIVIQDGWDFREVEGKEPNVKANELVGMTREAICNAYGIPVALLNPDKNSHPEEAEIFCWTTTIIPEATILAEILSMKLLSFIKGTKSKTKFEFDTSGILVLQKYKMELARIMVAETASGVQTLNEKRAERDLPAYPFTLGEIDVDTVVFGDVPLNLLQMKLQIDAAKANALGTGTSPSLSVSDSGPRDQSSTGEAQMIDQTGKR